MICDCTHKRRTLTIHSAMIAGVRWRIRECKFCGGGFVTKETGFYVEPDSPDRRDTKSAQSVPDSVGEVGDSDVGYSDGTEKRD